MLVEDNENDVLLTRRAFARAKSPQPLQVVSDGDEAIAGLKGEGRYANRAEYPLPELVLLDLKMPGKSGFEVLTWIRQQRTFRSLRVVVLTSSDQIRDVNTAYQLGANSFLVQPVDFENFVQVSQAVKAYWLWMSRSPEVSRPDQEAPLETEARP